MKHTVKLSFTVLATSLLVACGSSGGGNATENPSTKVSAQASTSKPQVKVPKTSANESKPEVKVPETPANESKPEVKVPETPTNESKPEVKVPEAPANESKSEAIASQNSAHSDEPESSKPSVPVNDSPLVESNDKGQAISLIDGKTVELNKRENYAQELEVDGKKLPISFNGIQSGGFTNISNAEINGQEIYRLVVSGAEFKDVKFGYVDGYVFHQGNVTDKQNVPTMGKATYNVSSVNVNRGVISTSEGTQVTADFGNKTLSGTIHQTAHEKNNVVVTIKDATISGNAFNGTVMQKDTTRELEGKLEGKFYGANAAELGGVYRSNSYAGAFGGKKQE